MLHDSEKVAEWLIDYMENAIEYGTDVIVAEKGEESCLLLQKQKKN